MDINGYLDMIPSENSKRAKFMAFLKSVLEPVMDLHAMTQNRTAYSVDTAAGAQLDTLGELLAISRRLPYLPASGNRDMSDETYSVIVKMRVAQESWNGSNSEAARIYREVLGGYANIEYRDNADCSVTITMTAEETDIVQAITATEEILVPAGVKRVLSVEAYNVDIVGYNGFAIVSMSYENQINLTRSGA